MSINNTNKEIIFIVQNIPNFPIKFLNNIYEMYC